MKKVEYYITDGNNFVKQSINGQFSKVSNITVADVWDKPQVAKAVLDNSVPRAWRANFYVAKLKDDVLEKQTLSHSEKSQKRAENTVIIDKNKGYELDLYVFDEDSNIQEIVKAFENVRNVLEKSKKTEEDLRDRLQVLDCAFEDLKHYHLKRKLGTVDAYKRDKLESRILLERRSVKTQLDILKRINQHHIDINSHIKDVCETISTIRNRKYVPRVLVDLFENGIDSLENFEI